jgi:uncharacterized protein YdeI (YjbR/CyaY-like superfamily)
MSKPPIKNSTADASIASSVKAGILENCVYPQTREEWRIWLSENHQRPVGIWVICWKKAALRPIVSYDELVTEALCFGWIDSKPNKLDEQRSALWFAPRKAKTGWSRPNKLRIERAIENGWMTDAGKQKIEAAKKDGSWSALDQVEDLVVPSDLTTSLREHGSTEEFEKFPRSAKRGILEWISNAKTAATREKRIRETAQKAALNERANQWKPKS